MVRARKDYGCELCREVIPKGSHYVFQQLTPWDGVNDEFYAWRVHETCNQLYCEMLQYKIIIPGEIDVNCEPWECFLAILKEVKNA